MYDRTQKQTKMVGNDFGAHVLSPVHPVENDSLG